MKRSVSSTEGMSGGSSRPDLQFATEVICDACHKLRAGTRRGEKCHGNVDLAFDDCGRRTSCARCCDPSTVGRPRRFRGPDQFRADRPLTGAVEVDNLDSGRRLPRFECNRAPIGRPLMLAHIDASSRKAAETCAVGIHDPDLPWVLILESHVVTPDEGDPRAVRRPGRTCSASACAAPTRQTPFVAAVGVHHEERAVTRERDLGRCCGTRCDLACGEQQHRGREKAGGDGEPRLEVSRHETQSIVHLCADCQRFMEVGGRDPW